MSDPWKERQWGRFRVSMTLLEETPEQVIGLIFGSMRILRAVTVVSDQTVHYEAVSPLFDAVPDCQEPPWYKIKLGKRVSDSGEPIEYSLAVEKEGCPSGRGL